MIKLVYCIRKRADLPRIVERSGESATSDNEEGSVDTACQAERGDHRHERFGRGSPSRS